MRTARVAKALSAIGIVFLLLFLLSKAQSVDSAQHDRYHTHLLELKESDAVLDDAVLRTRYRLLTSYDALNAELAEIRKLQDYVKNPPAYIGPEGQADMRREFEAFTEDTNSEDTLLQKFKSQNAVINNSLRYFPIASRNLARRLESDPRASKLVAALNLLVADVLGFSLTPEQQLAQKIEAQIDRLSQIARVQDPTTNSELLTILNHANTILEKKPALDHLTKELMAVSASTHAKNLYNTYTQHYHAALDSSSFYRLCLYVLSVALLCMIILKLRNATRGLHRAKQRQEQEIRERTQANDVLQAQVSERRRAEIALRESEKSYRELIENANDIIYTMDLSGGFTSLNRSGQRVTGYTREEALRMNIADVIQPSDAEHVRQRIAQNLAGASLPNFQLEILAKDGGSVTMDISSRLMSQDGVVMGIQGIGRDMTERKRAEAERQVIAEIVEGVITAASLDELFELSHKAINRLLSAENLFISLDNPATGMMHFEYWVDKFDPVPSPRPVNKGFSGYVLRTGQPLLLSEKTRKELLGGGEVEKKGTDSASWLGVPLRTHSRTIGVLVVQDYEKENAYSDRDLKFLAAVGDQVGLAIERKQIELELKTNEVRLNEAQQIANLGNWEWDVVTDKVRWSDELYRIFGLPVDKPGSPSGKFLTHVHPDDRRLAESAIQQAIRDKEFPNVDYRIIRPDGAVRALQCRGKVTVDHTGRVTSLWGTLQDITERKQLEEQLRQERVFLRTLIDNIPDTIYVKDLKSRRVIANLAEARASGVQSEAEVLGKDDFAMHPRELAEKFLADDQLVFQTGQPIFNREEYVVDKEGHKTWLLTTKIPLRNEGGEITGLIGLGHDVTEHKRAEMERQVIAEIVQSAITTANLDELFKLTHQSVNKILPAESCFIALHNQMTNVMHCEYWVDKFDTAPLPRPLGKGFSSYMLRTGKPLLLTKEFKEQMYELGEVQKSGTDSLSWLGVPLRTSSRTIGVLVVQDYKQEHAYNQRDLEFLSAVGDQLGLAIERKRIELELKANEMQLKEAQQIANLGNWEWDVLANKVSWSDGLYRVFGLKPQEFEPTFEAYAACIHPDDRELVAREAKKALETGVFSSYDHRIILPNGTVRTIESSGKVTVDESGRVSRIVGTAQDITERKRVEAELQARETQLREAQEIARVGSWEFDAIADRLKWSDELWRIFGLEKREFGLSFEEYLAMVHPDDHHLVKDIPGLSNRSEKDFSHDYRIIQPDGTVRVLRANGRVICDEHGQILKVTGTDQDITEQKRIEDELEQARDAALESTRLKSEFLANMSHEIRTPMNGVIGMTGLLLDTELSAEQQDFAETIRSSGDALLTIINDILDFSKMEAGKLTFETLDFDLTNAIEGTLELLAERAHAKHVELASLIFRDVPVELRGDSGRVRQVLTNLIGNAIKFTELGEVVVRAQKEDETETDVRIRFTVSDTGIGISEAAQENLFQAFVQADGSTTRKYGGTGLGLAISKQLVELMGGQIGVTSVEGKGSTFWFTARFDKQAAQVSPQLSVQSLSGLRALIVDDNATNRKILAHQLDSWDANHDEADSGTRALELLRSAAEQGAPYDLAILDLMMPVMDGFELARTIKADPLISAVHLVLLTSFGQRGDCATAEEVGVAAYITKPVRQSQLFQCLTSVLGSHATERTATDNVAIVTKHTLPETKPLSHKLILLAEDNMVNQKVAVRQLQKLGYRADAVANGQEALEALGRIAYDLVLMDCQMPEMDGYAATAEIRRREGTSKHTPIVAMTAHALEGDRLKCIAAGMDDYLSKPVKPDELERVLESLLAPAEKSIEVFRHENLQLATI